MIIQTDGNIKVRTSTDPLYDVDFYVDDVPNSLKLARYAPSVPLITNFYWDDTLGEYVVEYGQPETGFVMPRYARDD